MMKQIRDLEFQYIVATDLAARGIDIEGISHVINYELPSDLDFFVHRVGRTARAGHSGIAVTIYDPANEEALDSLEKQRHIEFKHVDLRGDEWADLGERRRRKSRKNQMMNLTLWQRKLLKSRKSKTKLQTQTCN